MKIRGDEILYLRFLLILIIQIKTGSVGKKCLSVCKKMRTREKQ